MRTRAWTILGATPLGLFRWAGAPGSYVFMTTEHHHHHHNNNISPAVEGHFVRDSNPPTSSANHRCPPCSTLIRTVGAHTTSPRILSNRFKAKYWKRQLCCPMCCYSPPILNDHGEIRQCVLGSESDHHQDAADSHRPAAVLAGSQAGPIDQAIHVPCSGSMQVRHP